MKRISAFLLAAALALSLCACGVVQNEPAVKPPATPAAETQNGLSAALPVNNGGRFVGVDGEVYYRAYGAAALTHSGMPGDFPAVPGAEKQMMVRHADGSVEALFPDTGDGPIAVIGGRFYLQTSVYADGRVYSVDSRGGDRAELLDGCILAADAETGRLLCQRGTALVSVRCADGNVETLASGMTWAGCADGRAYYSVPAADGEGARRGALALWSVAADGSDARLLAETAGDLYTAPADAAATVVCLQAVGDRVYFSYGAVSGTAHLFQGGRILRVGTDGTGLTQIAESPQADFYVARRNGADWVCYYEHGDGGAILRNPATGETVRAAFAAPIGVPYVDARTGTGCVYSDETGTPTVLFTAQNLPGYDGRYGCGDRTLLLADQVNVVGSLVFFRVLHGVRDAANDVGWRYAYTLSGATVCCRDLTTGAVTELYTL